MTDTHPFTRKNEILSAAALLVVAAGYALLRLPPAEGFCSLTLGPVLLVLGYCALIPWGILARGRQAS